MTRTVAVPHTRTQYTHLLVTYLTPQWRRVTILALALVVSIALSLLTPQLMRYFIDTARSDAPLAMLTRVALLYLAAAVLGQIIYVLTSYLSADVAWTATNALRADVALHCLHLDMSFHTTRLPGELMERIDGDAMTLSHFFSQFVVRIVGNGVLMVGVLALTFTVDWRLGLVLCCFVLLTLAVVKALQGLGVPYFKALRNALATAAGFWEERLGGTEDIRTSGAQRYVLRLHYQYMRDLLHAVRTAYVMGRVMLGSWEVLGTVGNAAVLVLAAWLLSTGTLTIGGVFLIYSYTGLLSTIVLQISYQLENLQQAVAAVERIRELYYTPNRVSDGQTYLAPGLVAVAFDHVTFAYAPGTPVLTDLSFTLMPGRVLGVLGRTGSGKTTLTRLIVRLYALEEGHIHLNGRDIRDLRLDSLRQRVGVVTQDVQLFQATVRDNLTLFDPQVHDEQLLHAIHQLGLGEWFQRLPHGLDTVLAAGGSDLSAGEAQVLALIRVFLKDPGLVILDEASSRLDPATERLVGAAVQRLLHGRTGIIIAHRLATVAGADEILMLNHGRMQEHGTYTALATNPSSSFFALLHLGKEEVVP